MFYLSIRKKNEKVIDLNLSELYFVTIMKKEKNNIQLCKCGCGEPVNQRKDGTFFDYVKYHHMRGENHPLYGIGHTKKSKEKMSKSRKGKKLSEEHKKKLSQAFSGENNPMYGKKHPEEIRKKISEATMGRGKGIPKSEEHKRKIGKGNKGKIISEEAREKMSKAHKGKTLSEEHKKNISKTLNELKPNLGKKLSEEHKKKLSESRKGKYCGKDNPNYGNHLSEESKLSISKKHKKRYGMDESHDNWNVLLNSIYPEFRRCYEYLTWRNDVFVKDNYICQKCGKRNGNKHAHHIKPFSLILIENNIKTLEDAIKCKELWDIGNGITLCPKCHKEEHKKKDS